MQLQILTAKTYCELAAKQPFFETLQSCVCTKVTLSHRFKSSPTIPGNLTVFCTAGYMMMAGHFSENHESSGDLNRRSQDGVPRAFWFFLHDAKRIKSFSLQRTSRFCKPRISPPEQQLHTNKIKSFPKGRIEVLQTSNQRTKLQLPTNPMKSFAAPRHLWRLAAKGVPFGNFSYFL